MTTTKSPLLHESPIKEDFQQRLRRTMPPGAPSEKARSRERSPRKVEQPSYMREIRHVLLAAAFAAFFAALWVLWYMLSVSYGRGYTGTPLIDYVLGNAFSSDVGADMLFVITARFWLAFGLLWMPLGAVMALIDAISRKLRGH